MRIAPYLTQTCSFGHARHYFCEGMIQAHAYSKFFLDHQRNQEKIISSYKHTYIFIADALIQNTIQNAMQNILVQNTSFCLTLLLDLLDDLTLFQLTDRLLALSNTSSPSFDERLREDSRQERPAISPGHLITPKKIQLLVWELWEHANFTHLSTPPGDRT